MRWLGQLQLTDVRRLSEGGHGEVFAAKLACADGISQEVVLKLARGKNPVEVEMSRRFLLQEARLTAAFNHPNIIGFRDYNVVEIDGEKVPCLIMEHGGVPLSAVIHSHGGRLDPGLAAFVGVEVLAALAYSHSLDVIHRDVKPQNVLIGRHGQVRLIDYGIAKAADPRNPSTVVTNLKGTPVYISPEAWEGKKLDGRSDLWSVGVMLFEMVIGRKPWEDDKTEPNEMTRLRRLSDLVMAAPLPELPQKLVPDDLAEVVTKLLMKSRDDRYEDALEAMYALEKVSRRLVGPWAAARELGQHSLAAMDPAARRRRPTLEESTANVRHGRAEAAQDEYVSVLLAPSESAASMVVPPEMLEDEPSAQLDSFPGTSQSVHSASLEVTAHMPLPPARRAQSSLLKYGMAAASLAIAASGAVFWSGSHGTAGDKASEQVTVASPSTYPAARGEVSPRNDIAAELPAPPAATEGSSVRDATSGTQGHPPSLHAAGAATDSPVSQRDDRAKAETPRSDAGEKNDRGGVGEVHVVLIPRGSYVSLDGQPAVKAPITFRKIRQGNHQLRVGLTERSLDRLEKVRVKPGEVARVELELANPFGE